VPVGPTATTAVTFISAHARPAASKGVGNLKSSLHTAVARWVQECPTPVVLGIDANAPDIDHPDADKIYLGWESDTDWKRHHHDPGAVDPGSPSAWGQDRLLGPRAWHLLRDAYRDVHEREGRSPVTPEGPLALSYPKLNKRYDHLLVSPSIYTQDCNYSVTAGREAGSDHEMAFGVLRLPAR